MRQLARALHALSAFILASGACLHALAYPRADAVIVRSGLPGFYAGAYRGLWWSDIGCSLVLALMLLILAVRPASMSREQACLIAAMPLVTALSIGVPLGGFYAAYVLSAAGVCALLGALLGHCVPPARPVQEHDAMGSVPLGSIRRGP